MVTKKREFIDPNALMQYINENHSYAGLPMASHILTMELLTYAPRVDVAEVKHSFWSLDSEDGYNNFDWHCDRCGGNIGYRFGNPVKSDYCPNCGAKMDGRCG